MANSEELTGIKEYLALEVRCRKNDVVITGLLCTSYNGVVSLLA